MTQGMRWGARMGDSTMIDMMVAALHDPFDNIHMGETARTWPRATRSPGRAGRAGGEQRRAVIRDREGRFVGILPVKTRKGEVVFDTDEHARWKDVRGAPRCGRCSARMAL